MPIIPQCDLFVNSFMVFYDCKVKKRRFSSIFKWCLPFVGFLHGDIRNRACGSYGTSKPVPYDIPWREYLSDSPSVRRLRNDFVVTAPEIALQPVAQEDASGRKFLSDSPSVRRLRNDFVVTAPEVALQPVTQGMPPKLAKPTPASLPPLLHPQRKCNPKFRTLQEAHLSVICRRTK